MIGQPLTLVSARQLALAVQRERAKGRDVVADRQAEQRRKAMALDEAARNTFAGACMAYIQEERRRKALNRRWQYSARILGLSYAGDAAGLIPGGLAERWRDRSVSSISADDLHELVYEARERGIPGLKPRVMGPCDGRARDLAGRS